VWYKFLVQLSNSPGESVLDHLSTCFNSNLYYLVLFKSMTQSFVEPYNTTGEPHLEEATEMLKSINETRNKLLGDEHIATAEAAYTLGLLLQTLQQPQGTALL